MVSEAMMADLLQKLQPAVEVGCAFRGTVSLQSWQKAREAPPSPAIWRSLYEAYQLLRQHQVAGDEMCWHYPNSTLLAVSHERVTLGALLRPAASLDVEESVLSVLRQTLGALQS